MELWTGERLGVDAAKACFNFDEVYGIDSFEEQIKELLKEQTLLYFELFNNNKVYTQLKVVANTVLHTRGVNHSPRTFSDITKLTQKMRLIKSEDEVALIKQALAITQQAQHQAMKTCRPEMWEYQLQAEYEYVFKKEGAYSAANTNIIAGKKRAKKQHNIQRDKHCAGGTITLGKT